MAAMIQGGNFPIVNLPDPLAGFTQGLTQGQQIAHQQEQMEALREQRATQRGQLELQKATEVLNLMKTSAKLPPEVLQAYALPLAKRFGVTDDEMPAFKAGISTFAKMENAKKEAFVALLGEYGVKVPEAARAVLTDPEEMFKAVVKLEELKAKKPKTLEQLQNEAQAKAAGERLGKPEKTTEQIYAEALARAQAERAGKPEKTTEQIEAEEAAKMRGRGEKAEKPLSNLGKLYSDLRTSLQAGNKEEADSLRKKIEDERTDLRSRAVRTLAGLSRNDPSLVDPELADFPESVLRVIITNPVSDVVAQTMMSGTAKKEPTVRERMKIAPPSPGAFPGKPASAPQAGPQVSPDAARQSIGRIQAMFRNLARPGVTAKDVQDTMRSVESDQNMTPGQKIQAMQLLENKLSELTGGR